MKQKNEKKTVKQQRWTHLLRRPFIMGILCIFVGDILQFFRKGDTGKNKVSIKDLLESVLQTSRYSLGSIDGFGVKVALCIQGRLFLQRCSQTGIHKVRGEGSRDGTQACCGHFEKFSIILLQTHTQKGRRVEKKASSAAQVWGGHSRAVRKRIMEDDKSGGSVAKRWPVTN